MKVKELFCLAAICFASSAAGQSVAHMSESRRLVKAKTTVATPEEDYYDISYVKMEIVATNTSTAIEGHVTTVARVVAPTMSEYYFELSDQLIIDSAKINGQLLTVTQVNTFVRKVTLLSAITQNTSFTAEVFYHGAPTGGTGFFTNGILNQTDATIPVQVTHTVSAAIHSRDWWPCKQSLTDKIDSADIWITVPTGLKVASNGLLRNVTAVGTGQSRYEWASRYPADYYLISFAVAPYVEYNYFMHFPNSTDSMLVQNYIYNTPTILQQHQDELDSIEAIINHFSNIFGRYPFDKEKFGICQTPLGGGMENQTMVSLGSLDITLIAHELAHQWWGDNVTCGSLKDMWLNEGFASYCEQLFVEKFHGAPAALSYRTPVFNRVINGPGSTGGSVYVSDTTTEGRIYSSRLTYDKGAAVAHMLRFVIGNDSLYFKVLQDYQQQFAYRTATTEDMKNLAEQITNQDLDTFFHQWVYMEGYPTYSATWFQNGSQVLLKLSQVSSKPSSVPVFKLPIEVKLQSGSGDTTIRIANEHTVQYYSFQWQNTMSGIQIDPNNHILNKVGAITTDPNLVNITSPQQEEIEIYPNPANSYWTVKHVPANSELNLTDILGKKIWSSTVTIDTVAIPAASLSHGTYILTITSNGRNLNYHLVR
jgi:aminopeptidase N